MNHAENHLKYGFNGHAKLLASIAAALTIVSVAFRLYGKTAAWDDASEQVEKLKHVVWQDHDNLTRIATQYADIQQTLSEIKQDIRDLRPAHGG